MKHYTLYIMAAFAALAGTQNSVAQNYTKDVDVTIELQPEVRAASRLDISPRLITKSFPASSPAYNSIAVTMPVTHMLTTLQPCVADPVYKSSGYDGYLVAGYLPAGNFGVSAGYRLVNGTNTRIDAWTQLNRNSYKGYMPLSNRDTDRRARLSATDFDLGLNLSQSTPYGTLSAATSLYLSHFNYPASNMAPSTQNVSRYRLGASWKSTLDDTQSGYAIEGSLDRFGYGKACFPVAFETDIEGKPRSINELSGNIKASGQLMFNDSFGMGLSLGYTGASLNEHYLYIPGDNRFRAAGKNTRGVVSLGASFRFNAPQFSGHIGPVIDFATGDHNGTKIGASGTLNWNLSPYFIIFTTAQSGTSLNTLGTLYDCNRYTAPLSTASPSFLNEDIKLGMSVGPFQGFSITARGGFSSAADWALPALADGVSTFATNDLSSAYYSIAMNYEYSNRFSVKAIFEGAVSNSIKKAYYRWSDRAKHVLDVEVTWRPIDQLTIQGGYELRIGRKICSMTSLQPDMDQPIATEYGFIPLGRVSAGRVSVNYAFNDAFGVFVRLDGLGQGYYLQPGAMPGQRLRGLAGFSLKF